MRTETRLSLTLKFFVAVSILGSIIVLFATLYPSANREDFSWRKPLVGSIFALVSIGGSLVALAPKKCSAVLNTHAELTQASCVESEYAIKSKGHHPDCGRFLAHTVQFGGVSLCAACTGLLVGAGAALAASLPYFSLRLDIRPISFLALLVGQLGLVSGLVQFKFRGWIRLAANAFFVIGGSLTLIGADQRAASLLVDSYVIGLLILWVLTRIMISQWDHFRICANCGSSRKNEKEDGGLTSSA